MYGETDFIQELLASAWPDWKLASRLGKGSYGSVYEIYRDDLGTRYTGALKVLYMESGNPENSTIPDASFPVTAVDFAPETAIGGGPVLLKGGKVENTWEAEMFYGDGADDKMPEARHPRTAIGVTKEGLLILFVCEGRGMTDGVAGMTFAEEAAVMKALGCVDALNLDAPLSC